jgi:hypothetical protein
MNQLIEYVESFAPGFSARIQPAPDEIINELAQLAGGLPDDYRRYLAAMGRQDGDLLSPDGETDPGALIDYYQYEVLTGTLPLPEGAVLIGVGRTEYDEMCLLPGEPGQAGPVVLSSNETVTSHWSDGLEKLLYRGAFVTYAGQPFPVRASYSSKERRPLHDRARELLSGQGFEILWFSDTAATCAQREDAQVYLLQPPEKPPALRICAREYRSADTIGAALADPLLLRLRAKT